MTNWVLKSRKVARPLFSWTNTGRWPLKEYTFPSRSSKATSELMCVTPAGKIGNCTCGMPKLLPHSAKKNTLLSPFCQSKPSRLIPPATYVPGRGIRSCETAACRPHSRPLGYGCWHGSYAVLDRSRAGRRSGHAGLQRSLGEPGQYRRDQQCADATSWGGCGTPGLQRGRTRRLPGGRHRVLAGVGLGGG